MAADKTANRTTHVDLTADTAYTVNLTGGGNTLEVIGHHHGNNTDIWCVVAGSEASLPVLTAGMDNSYLVHQNERVMFGKPRNDCWIRLIADQNITVSCQLRTTND